jgi:GT2 family glycosyltransferase
MSNSNLSHSDEANETSELASIIIVTYNHRQYLNDCITSIKKQDYPYEIIIVDNCSTDGTIQFIKDFFPDITIIDSKKNKGYGAGNNLGFKYANGKYIVILNPDVIVQDSWLKNLISPLKNRNRVITTSKILFFDGLKVNTFGNSNHFTGLTFTNGLGADPSKFHQMIHTTGVSGACFALTRNSYTEIGGFDESFFLYNEDSDFSWRANIIGYDILAIPDSIIFHDYQLNVNPEKLYFLEKGRYIIIRKYFSFSDLVILSPSLIIAELLTFGYASKFGKKGLKFKLKSIIDGSNIKLPNSNIGRIDFCRLDKSIPLEQLTFTKIDKIIKIIANKIFELNMRILE